MADGYKRFNNGILDKSEKLMNTIAERASFYRCNPQRFAEDYLGLKLKLFQQIILVMLFDCNSLMFLAARGLSKTYTTAVFCCIRAILFPGTQIVVASKTMKQAKEVLKKITNELMPNSANLRLEIDTVVINSGDAHISFRNGSNIMVTTATDTARGARCHILIVDEFRLQKKEIIDTVLKPFMRAERHPKYLDKPEYEHYGSERNKEIYMSSVWLKSHWAYKESQSYVVDLFNPRKNVFICGLPYQLAIRDGLLNRAQVEEDMMAATFNEVSFMMESGCLWFGESENSFFRYDTLEKSRRIKTALYPSQVYTEIPLKIIKPLIKQVGEIRILSADIAVMSSKRNKNDATAVFVLQLLPTKDGQYIRNVLYSETHEGGHSKSQAMLIRRLYEQMECDYIVLDTNGVGNGIFDNLVDDMVDDLTGEFYPAFTCLNDEEMAQHYKGKSRNPKQVIYSVKATSKWNSQCAYSLRDCIDRGKMRLLLGEEEFDEMMESNKAYQELSAEDKLTLKMPFIQTSLLINELVNLEYTTVGTDIKIKEIGTNRKDRYSSISYANQFANELERKLARPRISSDGIRLHTRVPKCMAIKERR